MSDEPLDPEVDPLRLFDVERQRGTFTRTEYGSRMDCTKNGCKPRHTDDGVVIPRSNTLQARLDKELKGMPKKINNHVVVTVKRTVTYSEWENA